MVTSVMCYFSMEINGAYVKLVLCGRHHSVLHNNSKLEAFMVLFLSGAQEKSSHNLRLLCGDLLTFCQHADGVAGEMNETRLKLNPQRIQSAMSLYTTNISAIVLTVDQEINSVMGTKEGMSMISYGWKYL